MDTSRTKSAEARLRKLCDRADEGYESLLTRKGDNTKPLLVVVHPGDMTEVDASADVFERSYEFQRKLAALIGNWTGEIAILHRQSCVEFIRRTARADQSLAQQLKEARKSAVKICYGDDLDAFVDESRALIVDRPLVVICGAYRDPVHGCVDYVAKSISTIVSQVEIDPDTYTAP